MRKMRLYSVRDPPGTGGGVHLKNWRNTVQRTEIVIKFKKNILQYYSPRTLLRKDFFVQNLFSFVLFQS